MLTDEGIKALLADIEADNVERTVATNDTPKFCEAICAFANDLPNHGKPGYLLIGAEDETGKIAGIEITDQLLQNLASHRDSGQIVPLPSLTVKNALSPKAILLWWKCSRPICHRSATVGSYIQYVRYDGTNLESDILDERRFTGDLPTSLRTLDAFVQTLFPSRPVPLSALQEKQVTPYPQWAIRELLMNAVMHRDYQSNAPIRFYQFSDRIEIQNPGGLYGAAADFPHQIDYRNPKIAEVMKNLAYVNRFGRGIATVQASLRTNRNQPAEFDISQTTFFLVKVLEANP